MPQPNPAEHNDFISHGGTLKISLPLVVDEHEVTGVTVSSTEQNSGGKSPILVQISTSGPLVLKETGSGEERKQMSSSRVISLRLRTPFIFMMMKVLKSPIGFLGGLPGPSVWKQSSKAVLAKLKSTFRKRLLGVSCSSCPARTHLLSLDASQKIRDPN